MTETSTAAPAAANPAAARGIRTTEFWGFAIVAAAIVANGTPYINIPGEQITILAAMSGLYGGGRTWLKKAIVKYIGKDNGNETT